MRKKYLPFIAIAIMTFFVACSNEDLITEENTEPEVEEGYTLSLTASMPDDEPDTRVALERVVKNINLTWQVNDWLQFAVVQDGANPRRIPFQLKEQHISSDGKTVSFTIALSSDSGFDPNTNFDLYGVYSHYSTVSDSAGISSTNPTKVILTKTPGGRGTLERIQNRGDVMLYFESKNIDPNNPPATVEFKHLGSLFSVSINNVTSDLAVIPGIDELTEVRLVGVDPNGDVLPSGNWAFNNGPGGEIFNLLSGEFEDTSTAGNYISFSTTHTTWVTQANTFWGWYPPIPGEAWPALRLQMTRNDGSVILESTNIKPVRANAPEAGKSYYFYASFNTDNTISFVEPFSLD